MRRSEGTSPLTVAVLASAYCAGIITVAVICCDDVLLPGETEHTSASPLLDGGGSSVLSDIAFVFSEDIEHIVGVTASVYIDGANRPLEDVRLYRTEGVLVVETRAETNQTFLVHFYFLDSNGEVVKEYLANLVPDLSLITYHDQHFADDYQSPKHGLPEELQATVGETVEISLENENRLWVGGRFVDLWRVIHLPADSSASANCDLVEIPLGQHFKAVGVASDGISGDTVSLEVLPQ